MRQLLNTLPVIVITIGMPIIQVFADEKAQPAETNASTPESQSTAVDPAFRAIQQSVEKYVNAYNAHKADVIAELYTANAELIDSAGTVYRGRSVIRAEYESFFETHPKASLRMAVDKVTFVTPTVAIEEGQTASRLAPDQPPSFSKYVAVHAKTADQWRLASVRDEKVDSQHSGEKLEDLSWMIGRWVDEAPDSLMEIDCYWHESGSFLMRDFKIRVDGLLAASGVERIGWDPLRQQVRSWLFDKDGGFLEGSWIRKGNNWTITAQGYRADGRPIQSTYVVTSLRDDAVHLEAINRTVGQEELDDFEMTVVRRPPPPGKVPNVKPAPQNQSKTEKSTE